MKNRIVAGLMAWSMVVVVFLTAISIGTTADYTVPQNMELTLVSAPPNGIAPHSIGIYIYNLSNQGETREVEVAVKNLTGNMHVDIIPDKFIIEANMNRTIYVIVRTGDIAINSTFNMTLIVSDTHDRAVSTQTEFTISIAQKEYKIGFHLLKPFGYEIIPIKYQEDAQNKLFKETENTPYYPMYYILYNNPDKYQPSENVPFIAMPDVNLLPNQVAKRLGNEIIVVYDANTGKYISITTIPVALKFSLSNIGNTIIDRIKINSDIVDRTDYYPSDSEPYPLYRDFVIIKKTDEKTSFNTGSNENTNAENSVLSTLLQNQYDKLRQRTRATTDEDIVLPDRYEQMRQELSSYEYSNLMPQQATSRITIGSIGTFGSGISSGTYTETTITQSEGETTGSGYFSPSGVMQLDLQELNDLSLDTISSSIGSTTDSIFAGNGGIYQKPQSGLLFTHEYGYNYLHQGISTGSQHVGGHTNPPLDDVPPPEQYGQITHEYHAMVNTKAIIDYYFASDLQITGKHHHTLYMIMKIKINIHTHLKDITRYMFVYIPVNVHIQVIDSSNAPDTPTDPVDNDDTTINSGVIVVNELTLTPTSGTTEYTIEDPSKTLTIPVKLTLHAKGSPPLLQGQNIPDNINVNYPTLKIRINSEISSIHKPDGKEIAMRGTSSSYLNTALPSDDGTMTQYYNKEWTAIIDRGSIVEVEPDDNGNYNLVYSFNLIITPDPDAEGGEIAKILLYAIADTDDHRWIVTKVGSGSTIESVNNEVSSLVDEISGLTSDEKQETIENIVNHMTTTFAFDENGNVFLIPAGSNILTSPTRGIISSVGLPSFLSNFKYTTDVRASETGFVPTTEIQVNMETALTYMVAIVILIIALILALTYLLVRMNKGNMPKL